MSKRCAWCTDDDRYRRYRDEKRSVPSPVRQRGFRFVGPTICYAFMQTADFVNDHETGCFRYRQVKKLG